MWSAFTELLFPRACASCGARPVPGAFCRTCSALLEPPSGLRCATCAEPLHRRGHRCEACTARPPPFDRVYAAFTHGGAAADAVHRLKYRGRREVAGVLGGVLASAFAGVLEQADAVCEIPLHRDRRRERGYDQALLLAREVAKRAGRPQRSLLARVRATAHQVGSDRTSRWDNLQGAFAARGPAPARVVLVDDVVTTTATARAAATALRAAGAQSVQVLAVSRAGF